MSQDDRDPFKDAFHKEDYKKLTAEQLKPFREEARKNLPTPKPLTEKQLKEEKKLDQTEKALRTEKQHENYAQATKTYNDFNKEILKQQQEPLSQQSKKEFNQQRDPQFKETKDRIEKRLEQMKEKNREKDKER